MKRIWCSISSHGFGHAAQVAPVLNELGRLVPGISAVLRTRVPARFFEGRLDIPWEVIAAEQDIGCVQQGPLKIDVAATWAAHARFHADWETRVEAEARAMRAVAPALVLSDISYLAIEAGARAKAPTVGLCNLAWDGVLAAVLEPRRNDQMEAIRHVRRCYGMADLMIRLAPGIPMEAFRNVVDVGPVAGLVDSQAALLRSAIGATTDERVVLVAFGGIAMDGLPFERLEEMSGYRFVVAGPVPEGAGRVHSSDSMPLSFSALLASADLLLTKPGYGMTVEAVAYRTPVVYVRRYNFADEAGLVEYLHRYGCGVELPAADFAAGCWESALAAAAAASKPKIEAPPSTGAAEAAALLARYL